MINIYNLKNRLKDSKLVTDSFWAISGNIVGKGLNLLTAIIIARMLGKEAYGEYGILVGTLSSILIFSNFGLTYTTTKYIAQYKATKPSAIPQIIKNSQKLTIVFSSIGSLLLFLFSEDVAKQALNAPNLSFPLQLISISILIGSISRTQTGILAGFSKFKELAKINTIVGITTFISGILLTFYYQLIGAIIALILIQIITCFLNRYYINKNLTERNGEFNYNISFQEILRFSTPVALQEALYAVLTYATALLLVNLSTYGEVGLSSAALYWSAIILFVPGILRNVILSHLSANINDEKRHLRILRIILAFNFSITFFISIVVYLLSDYIVKSYGDNFSGLKEVLNISVITTIFISMSNVYAQAYMTVNKNWLMLIFRIIRDSSILLFAYYLLVLNNGENGALSIAQSTLIGNILFLILMGVVYEMKLKNKTKAL